MTARDGLAKAWREGYAAGLDFGWEFAQDTYDGPIVDPTQNPYEGVRETCDREECFCCGKGHHCEPDRWPTAIDETWTCPECGKEHRAFDPIAEGRLPSFALAAIPEGTLGWRSGASS